jgi:glycosyltransferase involved in cell wall biosynthesis
VTSPPIGISLGGATIAVVNWRDPWHPNAGGAERYAWEMARGLAARRARVLFLTARAPGQTRRERRDGIEIVRLGGRFTVYPLVLGWLLLHRLPRRRCCDAVLDCQNGIPFFAPAVLPRRVPVFLVMHHVHTSQFGLHFPPWLARVGRVLEGPVARRIYRRQTCVAVSPSTVTAMRVRLRWKGDIQIIPNGNAVPAVPPVPAGPPANDQAGPLRLVWVGRLVAHKRPALILPVAERLGPAAVIDVIGRGPEEEALVAAIAACGLTESVRLRGFLPEAERDAIVAGAVLHLNTSQGEGWGLSVLEAAALGVPTVAYDVEGLRDAVRDGITGWLVRDGGVGNRTRVHTGLKHEATRSFEIKLLNSGPAGTDRELIEDVVVRALKELADPARRAEVAAACRDWAGQFSWDESAERMAALIKASLSRRSG